VNRYSHRGSYDGALQSISYFNSAGGELFISNSHFIHFKAILGTGSNNFAEFQALKLLLKCAKDQNIQSL
jgi:hypothetical protein